MQKFEKSEQQSVQYDWNLLKDSDNLNFEQNLLNYQKKSEELVPKCQQIEYIDKVFVIDGTGSMDNKAISNQSLLDNTIKYISKLIIDVFSFLIIFFKE